MVVWYVSKSSTRTVIVLDPEMSIYFSTGSVPVSRQYRVFTHWASGESILVLKDSLEDPHDLGEDHQRLE